MVLYPSLRSLPELAGYAQGRQDAGLPIPRQQELTCVHDILPVLKALIHLHAVCMVPKRAQNCTLPLTPFAPTCPAMLVCTSAEAGLQC